jgi:hypothetical protein
MFLKEKNEGRIFTFVVVATLRLHLHRPSPAPVEARPGLGCSAR